MPPIVQSDIGDEFKLLAGRRRAVAGRQPRGKKLPEVIPEVSESVANRFQVKQKLDAVQFESLGLTGAFGRVLRISDGCWVLSYSPGVPGEGITVGTPL